MFTEQFSPEFQEPIGFKLESFVEKLFDSFCPVNERYHPISNSINLLLIEPHVSRQ